MQIAQYKDVKYGFVIVREVPDFASTTYVQISEPLEVEFTPLPQEELVAAEVAVLDTAIEAIKAEAMKQVELLQGKRQELLALGGSDE